MFGYFTTPGLNSKTFDLTPFSYSVATVTRFTKRGRKSQSKQDADNVRGYETQT